MPSKLAIHFMNMSSAKLACVCPDSKQSITAATLYVRRMVDAPRCRCKARILNLVVTADEESTDAQPESVWKDDGSLPLDGQGQLPFFLLDAHEETSTPGLVYLFGKVSTHCLM